VFGDFDLTGFWENDEYSLANYVGAELTDDLLHKLEAALGYKLPAAYVEFMRVQNGGTPVNTCHATRTRTSWAEDHIAITGIYAAAFSPENSLCGTFGSKFWLEEWRYPRIGIYFADCPSAGHDMLCLDYRDCVRSGEPRVVHIDQEIDYRITLVAPTFEAFIRGLKNESEFPLD
jgi:hypothetical protein